MNHEQIIKEYFLRKHKYFDARAAFNRHKRSRAPGQTISIEWATELAYLAEEEGYAKALFTDFEKQYGHLITRNQ